MNQTIEKPLNKDIPIETVFRYLLKDYRKYLQIYDSLETQNYELARRVNKLTNAAIGDKRQIANLKFEIEQLKRDKEDLIIKLTSQ